MKAGIKLDDYKPTRPDEIAFLELVKHKGDKAVRDVIREQKIMHYKQCWYLLRKWSDRGIYDYGVVLDLGWLVDY